MLTKAKGLKSGPHKLLQNLMCQSGGTGFLTYYETCLGHAWNSSGNCLEKAADHQKNNGNKCCYGKQRKNRTVFI
jgi:hypothetical protein